MIPAGSVADHIVVRDGDDVVLLGFSSHPAKVENIGKLPMAWVDPAAADSRVVLASGAAALLHAAKAWAWISERPFLTADEVKRVATTDLSGRIGGLEQVGGDGGKAVTLVKGLALDEVALAVLGKQLRAACGSGGTVKDGVIEVQGDHCERVIAMLKAQGRVVKRAGG